jgi:hypothetical protein
MFRVVKCDRTFLKGCGRVVDLCTSAMVVGRVEYMGELGGITWVGRCCGDAKARKSGVTQLKSPMSTRSNFSYLVLLVKSAKRRGKELTLPD